MVWHRAGEIDGANNRDSMFHDGFVRPRQLTVATALGGKVDNHGAGRHCGDHLFGDQHRRLLAGNDRSRDHHIAFRDDFAQQLALLL